MESQKQSTDIPIARVINAKPISRHCWRFYTHLRSHWLNIYYKSLLFRDHSAHTMIRHQCKAWNIHTYTYCSPIVFGRPAGWPPASITPHSHTPEQDAERGREQDRTRSSRMEQSPLGLASGARMRTLNEARPLRRTSLPRPLKISCRCVRIWRHRGRRSSGETVYSRGCAYSPVIVIVNIAAVARLRRGRRQRRRRRVVATINRRNHSYVYRGALGRRGMGKWNGKKSAARRYILTVCPAAICGPSAPPFWSPPPLWRSSFCVIASGSRCSRVVVRPSCCQNTEQRERAHTRTHTRLISDTPRGTRARVTSSDRRR